MPGADKRGAHLRVPRSDERGRQRRRRKKSQACQGKSRTGTPVRKAQPENAVLFRRRVPLEKLRGPQEERRKGHGACLQCRRGRTPYGGGCIPKTQPPQARKRDSPDDYARAAAGPPMRGRVYVSDCTAENRNGGGLRRRFFRRPCLALAPCTCFYRGRLAGVRPNHGFSLAHRAKTATAHAPGNNAMLRPIGLPSGKLGAVTP